MTRSLRWLLVALVVCGCSGGGSPVTKVAGTVTLDNKALAGADVLFWPKDDLNLGAGMGTTGPDGRFTVVPDPRHGVTMKPGWYVVVVGKTAGPPGATADDVAAPAGGVPGARSLIPEVYGSKERSPLVVEVTAGDNDFPLALEGRPKQ